MGILPHGHASGNARSPDSQPPTECPQLAAALKYAALDLRVLPLCRPADNSTAASPKCITHPKCGKSAGKRPLLEDWPTLASTDPGQIREWWAKYANANIGVALGSASGVVAVDIDGEGGERLLADLFGDDLPPTWEVKTGNGRRLIFGIPDSLEFEPKTAVMKAPGGGELRAQGLGSQCVMPPSLHYSGEPYGWPEGHSPADLDAAAAMPPMLMAIMTPPASQNDPLPAATRPEPPPPDDLTRRRAVAYLKTLPASVSGEGGHAALFLAARSLVTGFRLPESVALELLLDHFNPRCSPAWAEWELNHKVRQAANTPFGKPEGYLLDAPRRAATRHHQGNEAEPAATRAMPTAAEKYATDYVAKIDPAAKAESGNPAAQAAFAAVYGFGLGIERGLAILLASYAPRCSPPLAEAELRRVCEEADAKPCDLPRGFMLEAAQAKEKPPAAADALAAIGGEAELFKDETGTAYAAIGAKTYPVRSKAYRLHLVAEYRKRNGSKVPNRDAIDNAVTAVEADAQDRPTSPVFVRVGKHGAKVYYHLSDDAGTVIEIDAAGWRVCPNPPVRFLSPPNATPQVVPIRGGSLAELRRFINCPGDDGFALLVGWLVAAMSFDGPFPLLVVTGEQSSAKSTTIKFIKALIDPARPEVRSPPKCAQDLMVAAKRSWVPAYDNLSGLPDWLSDDLAALATGGGMGTRTLFSDDEETLFDAKRPIILGGITDYVTRADLLDRAIVLRLPRFADGTRLTESLIISEFKTALPRILGALLDRIAGGLQALPDVACTDLPRMADAALFALACEKGASESPRFIRAYRENRGDAHEFAVADSPVAVAICRLMEQRAEWRGSATELLAELSLLTNNPRAKDWPGAANALTNRLRRDAPPLRLTRGIDVNLDGRETGGNRNRFVRITRPPEGSRERSSPQSASSRSPEIMANGRDDGGTVGDDGGTVGDHAAGLNRPQDRPDRSGPSPRSSRENATISSTGDGADTRDDDSRLPSGGRQAWHLGGGES